MTNPFFLDTAADRHCIRQDFMLLQFPLRDSYAPNEYSTGPRDYRAVTYIFYPTTKKTLQFKSFNL